MRKYFIILSSALALYAGSLTAQTPANRATQTVIADVLAQMPAHQQTDYNRLMHELTATGEEGVLSLLKRFDPSGKGNNIAVEYALDGWANYVMGPDQAAARTAMEHACLKALDQTNDRETRAFTIRLLEHIGSDACVDKLSSYLTDDALSAPAAQALAAIGSESAAQALQAALKSRSARSQEAERNIIQALGRVPAAGTEPLLKALLNTNQPETLKVLFETLSKVGTKASLPELAAAARKAGYTMEKTGAGEAYIRLINRVIAQGDVKEGVKAAADLLKKSTNAGQTGIHIAAMQAIMRAADYKGGLRMLNDALKDPSREYRCEALRASSRFADKALYTHLIKALPKMKPELQTDILNWMRCEAQASATKRDMLNTVETGIETTGIQTLQKLLNSPVFPVKEAAAMVLVELGNSQSIAPLASLLASNDTNLIKLGQQALRSFQAMPPHGDIAPAVVKTIPSASDRGKIAALELLSTRKATAFLNNVLKLTQSPSPEVKTAAFAALRDVVGEKDITNLCGMLETVEPSGVEDVQQALILALSSQTASQQFETLSRRLLNAGAGKSHLYYTPLAATGDKRALDMIVKGFGENTGAAKEAAFDALLHWNDIEAATPLIDICRDASASDYFTRALAGYVKLASNPAMTGENRMIYLRKALELAKTDAEKRRIISLMGKTGTYFALLCAGEYMNEPALKETSAIAVMNIALDHPEYTGEVVENLLRQAAASLSNPDADYQRQSIRKHLDEMPKTQSFVPLFNGKDLTGWKGLVGNPVSRAKMKPAELAKQQAKADEAMRRDWKVENGLLVFDGTGYDNICTEKPYGDFEMYVDWMLDPDGKEPDAGIYLRGTPQVQMWDTSRVDVGAQVGSGGLYNNQTHPNKPLTVADNKLGEWNTMYIKMVGDRVTVRLNGILVVDNIVMENYWDRSQPVPALEQIELQAHGSKVYYRNIYVKELHRPEPFRLSAEEEKEGFQILFDGTNMHEWTGNLVDYTIEDGCISVAGDTKFGGNLYTKKEYANFVYRFEFQLTPAANNGVGIRTPMEGDAAYVGMEIQVLDSEHPVYRDLHEYQYHGSVYGVIPARRGFLKSTGEWNTEEIVADGNRIKVTLNGEVIVDGDLKEAAKNGTMDGKAHPGLFNKSGHIGFLGHGSPVKFRNIRIRELK